MCYSILPVSAKQKHYFNPSPDHAIQQLSSP